MTTPLPLLRSDFFGIDWAVYMHSHLPVELGVSANTCQDGMDLARLEPGIALTELSVCPLT